MARTITTGTRTLTLGISTDDTTLIWEGAKLLGYVERRIKPGTKGTTQHRAVVAHAHPDKALAGYTDQWTRSLKAAAEDLADLTAPAEEAGLTAVDDGTDYHATESEEGAEEEIVDAEVVEAEEAEATDDARRAVGQAYNSLAALLKVSGSSATRERVLRMMTEAAMISTGLETGEYGD